MKQQVASLNEQAKGFRWPSIFRPMRYANVPAVDARYWTAIGTAMGDCTAEQLELGTGHSTLVLGAIFAVALAVGSRSRWTTKAAYWLPLIAVRAAGTTAGDWLAFRDDPGLNDGLHLGLPYSTALSCALFVTTLLLWKAQQSKR